MKKLLALLLALTLVFSAVSALAEEDSLAGNWIVVAQRNIGSLVLNDDGTAVMDGQEGLTWTEEGLDLGGFVIPFGLEGDKLIFFSIDGEPWCEAYREDSALVQYMFAEEADVNWRTFTGTYEVKSVMEEGEIPVFSMNEGDQIIFSDTMITLPGFEPRDLVYKTSSYQSLYHWILQEDGSYLFDEYDEIKADEKDEEISLGVFALEGGSLKFEIELSVWDEELNCGWIKIRNVYYADPIDN